MARKLRSLKSKAEQTGCDRKPRRLALIKQTKGVEKMILTLSRTLIFMKASARVKNGADYMRENDLNAMEDVHMKLNGTDVVLKIKKGYDTNLKQN
jgi:hypothetical protein